MFLAPVCLKNGKIGMNGSNESGQDFQQNDEIATWMRTISYACPYFLSSSLSPLMASLLFREFDWVKYNHLAH